jgi:hypothetical protein
VATEVSIESQYSETTNRYLLKKGVSSMKHSQKINDEESDPLKTAKNLELNTGIIYMVNPFCPKLLII